MKSTLLALLACLFLCVACASSHGARPDPLWREIEVEAPSSRLLFRVVLSELVQRDYPINSELNPGDGQVTTGWKTRLQPFSKAGWREKISVSITAKERGQWIVRAHASRQTNMAIVNPLDPSRAEWKWSGENPLAAEILLQSIRSTMDPGLDLKSGGE